MRKIKYFLLLFIFFLSDAYAQLLIVDDFKKDYMLLSEYSMERDAFEGMLKRFDRRATLMKAEQNKKRQKLIEEYNENAVDMLKKQDSLRLLMYNDLLTKYVKTITDKIVSANPELKGNQYEVFVRRSGVPNAANLGEGILYVNMELIRKLSYESELAFVIAHELAHDYKKHVFNNMLAAVILQTDNEHNKQLKKISRQAYNTNQAYSDYLNKVVADKNKFSRSDELEADSLGLQFFINAGYDPAVAANTLLKLDSLDKPMFKEPLAYDLFTFTDLPFDKSVLYENDKNPDWKGNLNYEIPDSLKTHPDCKFRAASLQRIVEANGGSDTKNKYYDKKLSDMNNQSAFELVFYYYKFGRHSESLFEALSLHQLYPENAYLDNMIVANLFRISESLKNHTFSKTVDVTKSSYTEAYNQLLRYLHQASFSELNRLARKYYEVNIQPVAGDNPLAEYVAVLFKCRDAATPQEREKLKKEFNQKYPKAVYAFEL